MPLEKLRTQIINSSCMRKPVFDLVPEGTSRILDVGCGQGGLLLRLERDKGCSELYGIDMDQQAISNLKPFVEYAEVVDIEGENILPPEYEGYFNVIIMHDFVEHLFDPWQTMANIRRYLKEDGVAIIATPNLMYWKLQYKIASGRFPYGHGTWHPGHLRWYTPASLLDVLAIAGYAVKNYCLALENEAPLSILTNKHKLTTIQLPPVELQKNYPDRKPITVQYPQDIRASYPAFFAGKLIAVCAKGQLLWKPQPITYKVDLLDALTKAVNNPFDLFNPPPMQLLQSGSFPIEEV